MCTLLQLQEVASSVLVVLHVEKLHVVRYKWGSCPLPAGTLRIDHSDTARTCDAHNALQNEVAGLSAVGHRSA